MAESIDEWADRMGKSLAERDGTDGVMAESDHKAFQATPNSTLREQIMDSNVPKNEREWWAHHTIERLERELAEARQRIERADHIILTLTMDHNSSPNYVKGFDMAQEYFQDTNRADRRKGIKSKSLWDRMERRGRGNNPDDAYRVDAERYRWLRGYRGVKLPAVVGDTISEARGWRWLFEDDADAAIDAARAAPDEVSGEGK